MEFKSQVIVKKDVQRRARGPQTWRSGSVSGLAVAQSGTPTEDPGWGAGGPARSLPTAHPSSGPPHTSLRVLVTVGPDGLQGHPQKVILRRALFAMYSGTRAGPLGKAIRHNPIH